LPFDKRFKKMTAVLCHHQNVNIMHLTKFRPSTFILFSTLVVAFCIAGRSISGVPAWPLVKMTATTDSATDDIRKMEWQTKEAFITGDTALFVKTFTADACLMPPNAPTLCGQRGISQFFKGARQAGVRDAVFTGIGLFGQTSEFVTQQGAFELLDGDRHTLNKGKVLIVWKKTDQGWRIFRQMLNFDAPMPAAAPPVK
jgi:ketosteroid isomerase-like protein